MRGRSPQGLDMHVTVSRRTAGLANPWASSPVLAKPTASPFTCGPTVPKRKFKRSCLSARISRTPSLSGERCTARPSFFFRLVTFVQQSGRKKSDKVIFVGPSFGNGPHHGFIFDFCKRTGRSSNIGFLILTEALLPLLQSSSEGRIVNVSSIFGLLRVIINEEVRQELNNIDSLTEERLDELLNKFFKDFEADALEARGWPTGFAAYKVAKAAMNAYSRMLARRHPALRVNCAHLGYVKTDITMNSGVLMPEEGARNVVKVALLPDGGPTGKYFGEGEEASFV
ncbi:(+)-neomenthol dehydrogenase-like [Triticum dicoccoides]|uniref:(+)-neomenthol dehydrogenase-like n=1 Tax=Triticum dicoccoides TaxID=85692 RepID=UPI00188FD5B6|nr:(+)-neomenthol dehydrogenase-like [Triticum dicoccoides]